jgi:hypothetical protein
LKRRATGTIRSVARSLADSPSVATLAMYCAAWVTPSMRKQRSSLATTSRRPVGVAPDVADLGQAADRVVDGGPADLMAVDDSDHPKRRSPSRAQPNISQ